MSMGHADKFFGFSISYNILNIPLSILNLPFPPAVLPLSSCTWVMHVSSLASPFPILLLTSPIYFVPTNLYFSIPAHFPLPPQLITLQMIHIYDSIPVLLVAYFVFLDSIIDSYGFIAILTFIVLIFFFFLNKSLQHFI